MIKFYKTLLLLNLAAVTVSVEAKEIYCEPADFSNLPAGKSLERQRRKINKNRELEELCQKNGMDCSTENDGWGTYRLEAKCENNILQCPCVPHSR